MDGAILTNDSEYTIFIYKNRVIRFRSPYSLEYYKEVTEWDNGYIVVMTKYRHSSSLIEEYIDIASILDDLCVDKQFLNSIEEVEVENGGH